MTAILAAAGSGQRLGAGGPKAFVALAGRPMIEWSLDAFRAAGVGSIVLAVPPGHDYHPAGDEPHGPDPALAPIPVTVVEGGATRSASVSIALSAVESGLVAIHDAARPLLTPELVTGVVATLETDADAAGAIAATAVTDTIKRADGSRVTSDRSGRQEISLEVGETVDRAELWAAQTPQVFRTEALRRAIDEAPDGQESTDEAMLIERAGGRVLIHESSAENLKVTTPLDLRLAELLLGERSAQ